MASKVLLVDGNSLIHRAYHALPPLTTTSGQPTNAAFGFVQMVLLLLETEQPDVAVLALDAPGPTFRHEMSEEYKANRPPMDEDLASQLGIIRELADAMGLTRTELPGFEADDIIGTLNRVAAEAGDEVLIVTGDRDLCQLVGPHTSVIATIKGVKQTKTYDEDAVREEFGVAPPELVDLKGLAGDTSDNIPGVPKVGPKTARDLLDQFGTIEALYQRLEEVDKKALRERLAENEDAARLSRELAKINVDAPVDDGLLSRRWDGPDLNQLRQMLAELEFTSLLERLPAPDISTLESTGIAEGERAIADLCSRARAAEAVGIALALEGERAVGIGIACSGERAEFVAIPEVAEAGSLFADPDAEKLPGCLLEMLADPSVPKVGHDLKGIARALHQRGIALAGLSYDTAVAAYLPAAHRGEPDCAALVAQYLGEGLPDATGPGVDGMPGPVARAVAQAAAALRLREHLDEQLEGVAAVALFDDVEMPLVPILLGMEIAGIAVDRERLDEIGDKLSGFLLEISQRVYSAAGEEFNLGSPKQIGEVLFEKLKLPGGRKGKTGWSTHAGVLEKLAVDHEIAALILQHREYAKLKSTYVDGLMPLIAEDGRIHTTFEQTVVATGRLSSRNPNLQNIPIRTDWGREIRSCFVAQSDGMVLMDADYSQIELRILAHLSGEESLIEAFNAGEDIHRRTAAAVFGVDLETVDSDMRRTAKTVNYAVIYGMGATALAQQLGIKRPEAQTFIDNYFERLPAVREYMDGTVQQARDLGYVETLMGRRRPFPEINSGDPRGRAYAERAAANAPLQGSASDIIKVAMVRLGKRLPEVSPRCRMLLQVHDDLVLELPEADIDSVAATVREVMECAAELKVPLVVEPKAGPNWRDMKHT